MYSGDEYCEDEITSGVEPAERAHGTRPRTPADRAERWAVDADRAARARGGRSVLRAAVAERFGFLTAAELAVVAADDETRLTLCLIRCGGCRVIAGAQDVAKVIAALEAAGDYCRDVSVSGRDSVWGAQR